MALWAAAENEQDNGADPRDNRTPAKRREDWLACRRIITKWLTSTCAEACLTSALETLIPQPDTLTTNPFTRWEASADPLPDNTDGSRHPWRDTTSEEQRKQREGAKIGREFAMQ